MSGDGPAGAGGASAGEDLAGRAAAALALVRQGLALLADPVPALRRGLETARTAGLAGGLPTAPLDLLMTSSPLAGEGLAQAAAGMGEAAPAAERSRPRTWPQPTPPGETPSPAANRSTAGVPHFSLRRSGGGAPDGAAATTALAGGPSAPAPAPPGRVASAGAGLAPAAGRILGAADLPRAGQGEIGRSWLGPAGPAAAAGPSAQGTVLPAAGGTPAAPLPGSAPPTGPGEPAAGALLAGLAEAALAVLRTAAAGTPGQGDGALSAAGAAGPLPEHFAGRPDAPPAAEISALRGAYPPLPASRAAGLLTSRAAGLPAASPVLSAGPAFAALLAASGSGGQPRSAGAPAAAPGPGAAAGGVGLTVAALDAVAEGWPSTAQALAGLVNEALQEQAQRHGVDLS